MPIVLLTVFVYIICEHRNYFTVPLAARCFTCVHDRLAALQTVKKFARFVYFAAFCGYTTHPTAKVSEEVNRKFPATVRNTAVQRLIMYGTSDR